MVAFCALLAYTGPVAADDLRLTYLAATCASCHGGQVQGIPGLAARSSDEVAAAVVAFRDGSRKNPIMNAAASGLDDATIAALSALLTRPH